MFLAALTILIFFSISSNIILYYVKKKYKSFKGFWSQKPSSSIWMGRIFFLLQPWDYFGRNDAKAETPVHCPPHGKSWLIGKDSDAGRDWGQVEKGTTEDEMAGWHHWLDGFESGWTSGVGDGQGGLACWDSWGHKESNTTERLNWTETLYFLSPFSSPGHLPNPGIETTSLLSPALAGRFFTTCGTWEA